MRRFAALACGLAAIAAHAAEPATRVYAFQAFLDGKPGGESPVDVWVSSGGDWVGLDSVVGGGKRKLSYRLP
jgi:hypothetical protein